MDFLCDSRDELSIPQLPHTKDLHHIHPGKEASSSKTDEQRKEYQRFVQEAQQATEEAIGALHKLAAARWV